MNVKKFYTKYQITDVNLEENLLRHDVSVKEISKLLKELDEMDEGVNE